MSGISSGVGLISGINSAQLIEQLIALERRPIQALQTRVQRVDIQRTAFLELSARLLSVQNTGVRFTRSGFFRNFSATSSQPDVASATASESAVPGSYDIRVHSLVSSHALISRGFRDADTTPVGAGTITIEVGRGRVNPDTRLETLNGGEGVPRGSIVIQDRRGGSATIDLSSAVTVRDVLDAINAADGVSVRASVSSLPTQPGGAPVDRIVIEDRSTFADGETPHPLSVSDRPGGTTAAALGIAGSAAGSRLDGSDLVFLSDDTALAQLNDGNGVGRINRFSQLPDFEIAAADGSHTFTVSLSDFLAPTTDLDILNSGQGARLGTIRITARSGASAEIDLSQARTVGDVLSAVNANTIGVHVTTVNDHFLLTDSSIPAAETPDDPDAPAPPERRLIIEDVSGFAAADLGIAADTDQTSVSGRPVYRVETVGDVLRAINHAPGNEGQNVEAVISDSGDGITLRFNTQRQYAVRALNGSSAAHDLGIDGAEFGNATGAFASRRLLAGLNTVLLQSLGGGRGVQAGRLFLSDRSGAATSAEGIDLSAAQTLQDALDLINADGSTGIRAAISAAGNGIELRDESTGPNAVVVSDVSGTLAADLGIAGTHEPGASSGPAVVTGANAQLQYIARGTLLAELNGGRGVDLGRFTITDSTGFSTRVDLPNNITSVGEAIDQINAAAVTRDGVANIRAAINDTGDGIIVYDQAGGALALTIADDNGGRAAADLRLAGSSAVPADGAAPKIDGSFEFRIAVGASDTLQEIARKINDAGGGFSASIFNDHSGRNPFSLSISSETAGTRGELSIDTGGIDLALGTLSRARDAVVSLGGDGSARLITSSTNTLRDVIPGVTVDLLAASDDPVTVSVSQNIDGIVEDIQAFVDAFNAVQESIGAATRFNPDTQERGPLLGDTTVNLVRNRMNRMVSRTFGEAGGTVTRLFSVGLRIGVGNRLEFDSERFRRAYEESPEQVESLFSREETGFGDVLKETVDGLTRDFDGVLARKSDALDDQKELLNDRIGSLNLLLNRKRARLQAQFAALENALAGLQNQQTALGGLQLLQ